MNAAKDLSGAYRPISFPDGATAKIIAGRKTRHTYLLNPQPNPGEVAVRIFEDRAPGEPERGIGRPMGYEIVDPYDDNKVLSHHSLPWRRGQFMWMREPYALIRANKDEKQPFGDGRPIRETNLWWVQPTYYISEPGIYQSAYKDYVLDETWQPSSAMPLWCARVELEVKNVRIAKLSTTMNAEEAQLEGFRDVSGFMIDWLQRYPDMGDPWVSVLRFRAQKRLLRETPGEAHSVAAQ
jgi:hypothetical protein